MNRTYLLDEITKIRRVIIEKSGKFTLKECESIAAALEVDNVSLVAMLEAIRKDLFPQKFVLNLKDAERFQLLRSTLQKNVEHVILKKIAPELAVLAENFKKPQADSEVCQQAINKLRIQIKPYAEKVPKLVKYLNEYADLCEANFLNVLRLKVLRINLRFLPLLKEANNLFDTCDNTSDKELYWKMAEQLYLNFPSLFKEEVFYFTIKTYLVMKGKVFSSSQDLYQDQAKILFDFYKDAAEKIVSQEEELEKEMGELKNSLTMNATGKKKAQTQMYVGIGILVVGLVLIAVIGWLSIAIAVAGLYWGMKNYKLFKSSGKSIDDVGVELKELENKHQQIFRDYKIEKMGVVYVPRCQSGSFRE